MTNIAYKGHSLVYLKTKLQEEQVTNIVEALRHLQVSTNIVPSIQELLPLAKSNLTHGLLITDMSHESADFKNIITLFPQSFVICINETASNATFPKNEFFIKGLPNIDKAIEYLRKGAKQSPQFKSRVFTELQKTNGQNTTEGSTIPSIPTIKANETETKETEEMVVQPASPNEDKPIQEQIEVVNPPSEKVVQDSKNSVTKESIDKGDKQVHEGEKNKLNQVNPEKAVIEVDKIEPIEEVEEGPIHYEENVYFKRSRNLQKQLSKQKWEENRMVGIWSPLHRTGVTSLTIDFAFYLAQNRIYTAVLEGLTEQHSLKDRLKRYTNVPRHWESYAKAIQTDGVANQSDWTYKNVTFLPLDKEDSKYEWNSMSLESYMTTTKIVDVTLVDLPTGKMASYTMDTLSYLDELWIVVDDAIQETLAWKSYIKEFQQNVDIPISLIFNKTFPFSQSKRLGKELDLPVIATLPSLHEETMKNYYENTPLYFQESVQEKVAPAFYEMATHLFENKFEVVQRTQEATQTWWLKKIWKPLKG
ncbi:MAG: hypothetical protein R3267_09180 [Paenisporosarcina sp.]|nr:hypothetical protein [Paenisporosarcina sp.]